MNNNHLRIITALCIGAAFIFAIFFYRPIFNILVYVIAVFMLLEWYTMTKESNKYLALGLIVIPPSIISLFIISDFDETGWLLFTYFCSIWTVDTMAMIGGKIFKGPKLAPKLSPKKTVSGFITGIFSSLLIVMLISFLPNYNLPYDMPENSWFYLSWLFIAIIAQFSDLFVSFFKRKFNLKDSGTIIPGHGGMLDRFDSIILTAPLLLGYLEYFY